MSCMLQSEFGKSDYVSRERRTYEGEKKEGGGMVQFKVGRWMKSTGVRFGIMTQYSFFICFNHMI